MQKEPICFWTMFLGQVGGGGGGGEGGAVGGNPQELCFLSHNKMNLLLSD